MLTRTLAPLAAAVLLTGACDLDTGSRAESRMAVDESVATGQADAAQQTIVEISTSFTLGDAVDKALADIEAFIQSQAACTTVTRTGDRGLRIDFGALADACEYRGHTYAGVITIELDPADGDGAAVVHHTAEAFTNGVVTLDGTADVTWTRESRRVVSDLEFVRDARTTAVQSDRTQRLLDPDAGLVGGITVDGDRAWQNEKGEFSLTIEGVELRPADPVPQAGTYRLTVPSGNTVTMTFTRLDDETIEVRVDGLRRDIVFHVTTTGAVDEQDV